MLQYNGPVTYMNWHLDDIGVTPSHKLTTRTNALQYNGPVTYLNRHLDDIGVPAPPPPANLADFLLDTVIGAPRSAVDQMVCDFNASALCAREREHVRRLRVRTQPAFFLVSLFTARVHSPHGTGRNAWWSQAALA